MASSSLNTPSDLGFLLSPTTPQGSQSSSWKSVFRFPSTSNKRIPSNATSLTFDTLSPPPSVSGRGMSIPATAIPTLSPVSISDQRSSYNSSTTQSTDSSPPDSRSRLMSSPHQVFVPAMAHHNHPVPSVGALSSTGTPASARPHIKSEKQRIALSKSTGSPRGKGTPVHPLQTSTSYIPSPTPSRSRTGIPLNPKAIASRFIRRVASAPNAKGMFFAGLRSPATTKNGFLAPGDTIPPVPPLLPSYEKGTDSLETLSSSSSRGANGLLSPPATASVLSMKDRPSGAKESPDKVAFKRTYSSNSIKVREVKTIVRQFNASASQVIPARSKLALRISSRSECLGRGTLVGCTLYGKRRPTSFLR